MVHFNPRSRVGNDPSGENPVLTVGLFQSTFPRGERQLFLLLGGLNDLFQSTFPRGERLRKELSQ